MKTKPDISVIILTKNAEINICDTLFAIEKQTKAYNAEIIVIDSGSTDKTVEIIKSFKDINLMEQLAEKFHHSRTRNLGGLCARGKYLIFFNGDAIPFDEFWLAKLIEGLESDSNTVAVYSRHIPKKDCFIYVEIELLNGMRPIKKIKQLVNALPHDFEMYADDYIQFSTVSCAIRSSIWKENMFNETLPMAEDQEWAKRMLLKGYKIIYEPASMVWHSHNYTVRQTFRYYRNNRRAFNIIFGRKNPLKLNLQRIYMFPLNILKETATVACWARKKRYGLTKTASELFAVFSRRLAALTGDIIGNN